MSGNDIEVSASAEAVSLVAQRANSASVSVLLRVAGWGDLDRARADVLWFHPKEG